ncbi:hypothetical protein ACGFXC_08985 [Streptomyces sp. NPDC048507]|uniref:hypothetical protein n=1 Tax=Streptomyces sp. NPDC048507 TaxID=3365560 RepID=UPI0037151B24
MSAREELLAHTRSLLWRAWSTSPEELASAAVDTLMGLGMLVPEGDAQELARLRARVSELQAERHGTNECLSDAAERMRADRDRIAELEAERTRPAPVLEFVAPSALAVGDRVRFVTADNGYGGIGAVWRNGTVAKVTARTVLVDCDQNLLGDTAVLRHAEWGARSVRRAPVEDPHDSPLHHTYRVSHDLPRCECPAATDRHTSACPARFGSEVPRG